MATLVSPDLKTGHIGLNVSDLERSVAFYTRVFGFDVQARGSEPGKDFAFLGRDGTLMVTLWPQSDGSFSGNVPGLHHLSFQVETVEEVREAERRLRDLSADFLYDGVVPHAEGAASGGIFFTDPDGIRLELYTPKGEDLAPAPSGSAPTCGFF
ncbi:VOC family protein [Spirillospora sp. CA-294931]|uniref:VOC family protein n=1 Tax=Spirillospora sp. CA-294931 TaxID=3240042 RepID=UPI003D924AC7